MSDTNSGLETQATAFVEKAKGMVSPSLSLFKEDGKAQACLATPSRDATLEAAGGGMEITLTFDDKSIFRATHDGRGWDSEEHRFDGKTVTSASIRSLFVDWEVSSSPDTDVSGGGDPNNRWSRHHHGREYVEHNKGNPGRRR